MREVGWVQTMQRLVGQGNNSDLYSMSIKTTLNSFRGGCHDSKFQKYHSGCDRKNRLQGSITDIKNTYSKVKYG